MNNNHEQRLCRQHPQDDVPAELITHYIVRDYIRMFDTYHELLEKAKSLRDIVLEYKNKEERYKKMKQEVNNLTVKKDFLLKKTAELGVENRELKKRLQKAERKLIQFKQLINSIPDEDI